MSEPNYTQTASGPADYGFEIAPSDTVDLPYVTRQIRASGGGVIKWLNMFGDEQQHTSVEDGERVAIRARRVLLAGTTATGLEGLA